MIKIFGKVHYHWQPDLSVLVTYWSIAVIPVFIGLALRTPCRNTARASETYFKDAQACRHCAARPGLVAEGSGPHSRHAGHLGGSSDLISRLHSELYHQQIQSAHRVLFQHCHVWSGNGVIE